MSSENSVLIREGAVIMCALAELNMIDHYVVGNGKVAHKNIVRVAIHFTDTAHDQLL